MHVHAARLQEQLEARVAQLEARQAATAAQLEEALSDNARLAALHAAALQQAAAQVHAVAAGVGIAVLRRLLLQLTWPAPVRATTHHPAQAQEHAAHTEQLQAEFAATLRAGLDTLRARLEAEHASRVDGDD